MLFSRPYLILAADKLDLRSQSVHNSLFGLERDFRKGDIDEVGCFFPGDDMCKLKMEGVSKTLIL